MSKKKIVECFACGNNERELVNLGKHYLCKPCLTLEDDTYEKIDIDIDDTTMAALAQKAMEENVTLNAVISHALLQVVRNPSLLEEWNAGNSVKINNHSCCCDGNCKTAKKKSVKKAKK